MVGEKKTAADYFPFFFLGFLSPSLLFFLCVNCKASSVNVYVCVYLKDGGRLC